MAKNRVQCSLIITDSEVFENLVLPTKMEKRLNMLVVQLLTAYYYNDDIRQVVDEGVFEEDETATAKRHAIYEDINETLMTMDFLAQDGKAMINDGTDLLSGIMQKAEDVGMTESVNTGVGEPYQRVTLKKLEDKGISKPEGDNLDRVDELEKRFSKMEAMLQQVLEGMSSGGVAKKASDPDPVPAPAPVFEEDTGVGTADDAMAAFLESM